VLQVSQGTQYILIYLAEKHLTRRSTGAHDVWFSMCHSGQEVAVDAFSDQ